jgi:hypothetical protein
MYTILICGAIGLIALLFFSYKEIVETSNKITIFLWLFIGAMGFLLGMVLGLAVVLFIPPKTEVNKYTIYLETLQDNSSTSGSFFLGCGNINGSMRYTYYYMIDSNTYKMDELYNNENVTIKYITNINDKPRIEQYRKIGRAHV